MFLFEYILKFNLFLPGTAEVIHFNKPIYCSRKKYFVLKLLNIFVETVLHSLKNRKFK